MPTPRPRTVMPGSAARAARSPQTGTSSPRSKTWTSAQAGSSPKSCGRARIELWCGSGPPGSITSSGFLRRPRRCGSQTTISIFATVTWLRSPFEGSPRTLPTTSCGLSPVGRDRRQVRPITESGEEVRGHGRVLAPKTGPKLRTSARAPLQMSALPQRTDPQARDARRQWRL